LREKHVAQRNKSSSFCLFGRRSEGIYRRLSRRESRIHGAFAEPKATLVLCQNLELGRAAYKPDAQAKEKRGTSFACASGLYPKIRL
jgi:hypothetical protein